MIPSTNAYNNAYSEITGIKLDGNAQYSRGSGSIKSKQYMNTAYHYEFWNNHGSLFASIHIQGHPMLPSIEQENLINQIKDYSGLIVKNINKHITGFVAVNHPELSGGIGNKSTHTFNIACSKDPVINSQIMYIMINFVSSLNL